MTDIQKWYVAWSPFWEFVENRHLSIFVTEKLLNYISSPVLIIGAGQGLIVEYLRNKGFIVDGIDIEKEMIRMAKKRRSIDIILADAKKLPFKDKSYKTVIIASGIVDYLRDDKQIKQIIDEGLRVTAKRGSLFISFYQMTPVLEKIYKKIGVIDSKNQYHMKRIFDIDKMSRKNPLTCISPIKKWTNKKLLPIFLYWTKLGLTLPKELKEERKKTELMFDTAKKNNIDVNDIYESIPDSLPYREVPEIKKLLKDLGYIYSEINKYNDCIIVKFHKSGSFNLSMDGQQNQRNKKNWIIKTENLCKKYYGSKIYAVDSVNITIGEGTIFGLLGPNGAGKTTTLSMLCGLLDPTSGNINFSKKIDKKNIQKIIGYVPQELALYPRLTAKENLIFFGKLYDINSKELQKRVNELLSLVGLKDRANDLVKNYSNGMMRRLNIAIGLINKPDIILLDEPTVGIDPQSRNCIFELVLNLKNQGVTILYTTHYMEKAARLCDVLAIMDHGRIVVEGSPKELVQKYGFYSINFKIASKYPKVFVESLLRVQSVFDISIIDDNLMIISESKKNNMEIIEKIKNISKKNNVNLSLTNVIEPNLESLFLDITGRNLRDTVEESVEERIH